MSYTVHVTREGDTWLADVPAVAGAHTFARSLDGLAKSVREVVVLMDDLPDDAEVELDFHYEVDDKWVVEAERLRRIREDIDRREAELVAETGQLATKLSRTYSVRDTAAMLGVTAGRVSQLAASTLQGDTILVGGMGGLPGGAGGGGVIGTSPLAGGRGGDASI